ncbi:MAG: extracellular solute-binding protein, partial [Clostridia bacterium]|nr:extracellular solute-binding protein [Clostridia bacterium]
LPDIVCTTYPNLVNYVPEDMFINLSEHMDVLPNYAATLEKYSALVPAFKVDGDLYWFIMTAENAPDYGNFPMVRQDVLAAIGWDHTPDNYEELYEMLKAIKKYDPDCIPMVTRGTDVFWRMGYAFGTYNGIYLEPDFDQYQYGPLYDRYKTFLEFLNRLYTEGLLDPDFASSNKAIWMEYLTSGKSYFFFENGSFATDINLVTTSSDPVAKFVPMKTLENYFGTRRAQFFEGSGVISPFRNDVWVISSSLKGEKLEAALKFMDYLYSEEGAYLCSYGIEGVNYTIADDGTILFDQDKINWYLANANDPYREFCNEIGIGCLAVAGRFYDDAWYEFMDQDSRDMYAFWLADKNILPYTYTLCLSADDTAAIADIKTACDTFVATESLKFVTGIRPLSEFYDFVNELKKLGAETIEETYNAAYQLALQ